MFLLLKKKEEKEEEEDQEKDFECFGFKTTYCCRNYNHIFPMLYVMFNSILPNVIKMNFWTSYKQNLYPTELHKKEKVKEGEEEKKVDKKKDVTCINLK